MTKHALDAAARERIRREFLAAALCHELKQPLHALNINVELLTRRLGAASEQQNIASPVAALARAVDRIGDCLDAYAERATPAGVSHEAIDLGELITVAAERAAAAARREDVRVALEVATMPPIQGDGLQLSVALDALLDNALRASPAGGVVTVQVELVGEDAHVVIADTGAGMGPEVARRAFEIGLSTWGGEGIGLTIAKFIAYHHSGSVTVKTGPHGSTLTLVLPATQDTDEEE